jgi:O-acetyl-ADP-ribose deacetylase
VTTAMNPTIIQGDLLDQDVDVIVNACNRNIIPWWLLLPQGVSGAIKRRGGTAPFKELAKHGSIPLGGVVLTSAGRLPFKGVIHVAGINMFWQASEWSIRQSVKNAMALAAEKGFKSIAFPLIGAGLGGFNQERAKAIMADELAKIESPMEVRLVFKKAKKQMPWWCYGVQLIFFCLLLAAGGWRGHAGYQYVFMGACAIFVLVTLVDQFIKQQAQYTIKTMMIATFVVAIFCSIYSCFGFDTVFWLVVTAYLAIWLSIGLWTVGR